MARTNSSAHEAKAALEANDFVIERAVDAFKASRKTRG
jgi:hypothetical protein